MIKLYDIEIRMRGGDWNILQTNLSHEVARPIIVRHILWPNPDVEYRMTERIV